jgi:cytochrome c-type biogenesis protein CcmE
MNKSYIIGGVVILLAMVMAIYSFKTALTQYVTVSEAKVSPRTVQVAGIVAKGSEKYDFEKSDMFFTLLEDTGEKMTVQYKGTRPANFDDVTKIVVTGRYDPAKQIFEARELLVKCPTKYEERVKSK